MHVEFGVCGIWGLWIVITFQSTTSTNHIGGQAIYKEEQCVSEGNVTVIYHAQVLREENKVMKIFTNEVFFFAGDVTVAMPYLMRNLHLVVLVLGTRSIEGESWMSTNITERIRRGSSDAHFFHINNHAYYWSWRWSLDKINIAR